MEIIENKSNLKVIDLLRRNTNVEKNSVLVNLFLNIKMLNVYKNRNFLSFM